MVSILLTLRLFQRLNALRIWKAFLEFELQSQNLKVGRRLHNCRSRWTIKSSIFRWKHEMNKTTCNVNFPAGNFLSVFASAIRKVNTDKKSFPLDDLQWVFIIRTSTEAKTRNFMKNIRLDIMHSRWVECYSRNNNFTAYWVPCKHSGCCSVVRVFLSDFRTRLRERVSTNSILHGSTSLRQLEFELFAEKHKTEQKKLVWLFSFRKTLKGCVITLISSREVCSMPVETFCLHIAKWWYLLETIPSWNAHKLNFCRNKNSFRCKFDPTTPIASRLERGISVGMRNVWPTSSNDLEKYLIKLT